MTLLGGVCWAGVLDELLARTPQLPGDVTLLYQRPHELLSPRHRLLAVCAVEAGRTGCVTAAGDLAGGWLYDAARSAYRVLVPAEHHGAFPAFRGWVRKDPMLPSLPLLGLALAHAERAREPLIVIRADLGPLVGGRTTRRADVTIGGRHTIATLIELSQPTPEVWAHELAHALDPADPRRDPVASEAFADTLGALLLAHQPDTLAELDALTTRADTEINRTPPQRVAAPPGAPTVTPGPSTDDELPAPGVDSLLAFAGLDLRSWAPACT